MRLHSVQVRDFRCVEDSNEFSLAQVTSLVGKNESGKTALLKALHKLNPDQADNGKFTELDYPRRKWLPDSPIPADPPALTTTWHLSPEEVIQLEGEFGQGAISSETVIVTKSYDNARRVEIAVNEAKVVAAALAGANLSDQDLAAIEGADSIQNLMERLQGLDAPTERHTALLATIKAKFPKRTGQSAIGGKIEAWIPKFVYFGQYYSLPGQVALSDFLTRKANSGLVVADHVFEALLALAGTTPEAIDKIQTFEQLNASLTAVSNRISAEIFEYWSQNRHLDAVVKFEHARPGDKPPFNTGYVFYTRIYNRRHRVDTSFDERSTGFVWFFSFLVWFSQVQKQYGSNLIVLLDEPGLSLHARAQEDLLRYIKEKLAPNFQVVYTTHSPFMLDPDDLSSARTVEDVVDKQERILGTKVGERVLSVDVDTVSPLQAALGYNITQTLFIGKHSLLVEGPSEVLYLPWFSRELQAAGRTGLDVRWTVCPVNGIDKIPAFVSLFGGNKIHVAAVVDVQVGAKQKIQRLMEIPALKNGHVLTVDTFAGQAEADTEDLLGRPFYVTLVNGCYNLAGNNAMPTVKPATAPIRVVVEAEDHFRTLPPNAPGFDHCAPASYLIENATAARDYPGYAEALDRFERLFEALNALLV
jgi:energy-coupling factor transporter ATP-binding protein EcfA2